MTSTVHLTTKEDRRTWQALTRCAPTEDDDAARAFVCLDGRRAYATDAYLVGTIDANVDLPIVEHLDEETGELTYAQADRILLPARLLRDAIGLAKAKTHVRIVLTADGARLILGDDPLPGMGEAPSVQIPYADAPGYPAAEILAGHVEGDPATIFVDGDDDRTVELAGEVVAKIGLSARRLGLLGALEYRHDGQDGGHVTIRPRPPVDGRRAGLLEVRAAATGVLLGVLSPLHLGDVRPGHTASGEPARTEVTITSTTAETLGRHLGEDDPDA